MTTGATRFVVISNHTSVRTWRFWLAVMLASKYFKTADNGKVTNI